MTHAQVLEHLCRTVGLVYRTRGDYTHASDGFCNICLLRGLTFQHKGDTLAYVRQAVIAQLERDGLTPDLTVLENEEAQS